MPLASVYAPGSRLIVRATGDATFVQMVSLGDRSPVPLYFVEPPVTVHPGQDRTVTVLFHDQVYLEDIRQRPPVAEEAFAEPESDKEDDRAA